MTAQLLNEWAGFAAWAVLAWLILTTVGALPLAALGLSKRWWPFLGAPVGVSVVALATFLTVVVPVHWVWWWPVLVALVVSGSIWAIRAGLRTTSDRASLNAARGTRPELPGKAADKTGIDAQKKPGGVSASAFGWTALG